MNAARAGRLWAWVPAGILVALLGTQLCVLASVLDDPAASVERDYYQKGLDWDAHQARQRQSQALGWKLVASTDSVPASGHVRLQVLLRDAAGHELSGVRVSVIGFPNARANQIQDLVLQEAAPGRYVVELGPARPGLWEFRLQAVRGADAFEQAFRLDLPAESGAS
jgi:nitrogen fixation protein FixH